MPEGGFGQQLIPTYRQRPLYGSREGGCGYVHQRLFVLFVMGIASAARVFWLKSATRDAVSQARTVPVPKQAAKMTQLGIVTWAPKTPPG